MSQSDWRHWRVFRATYPEDYDAWTELGSAGMNIWIGFDHEAASAKLRQAVDVHANTSGINEIRYDLLVHVLHLDVKFTDEPFLVQDLDLADDERAWCASFGIVKMYGDKTEDDLTDAQLIVTPYGASVEFTTFLCAAKAHVLWTGHVLDSSSLHYTCKPDKHDGSQLPHRVLGPRW